MRDEIPPTKPELRVLQVFGSLGIGGAETWLLSLLKYFEERKDTLPVRVRTDICLTSGLPGVLDAAATELGARLHYLPYSRRNVLSFTRQFRRLLASETYNVIHDHQDYSAGIHFLLGLGRLPPVKVAHVHNPFYRLVEHRRDWLSRLAGDAGKYLLSVTDTVIACTSNQLLEEYGFVRGTRLSSRAHAAYCGFDVSLVMCDREACRQRLRTEFGWAGTDCVVLFVGRLGGDELAVGGRSHKNPQFALDVITESRLSDSRMK